HWKTTCNARPSASGSNAQRTSQAARCYLGGLIGPLLDPPCADPATVPASTAPATRAPPRRTLRATDVVRRSAVATLVRGIVTGSPLHVSSEPLRRVSSVMRMTIVESVTESM